MTQLPKETQKNGDTSKSERANKHTKHKPRLNMDTKKHTRPNKNQNGDILVPANPGPPGNGR